MSRRLTPEATIGPFYPGAFVAQIDAVQRPVPSLVVELWQANAYGRYRHPLDRSAAPLDPQFDGFARLRTDDDGRLRFCTIKPGSHPVGEGSPLIRAPHLRLTIFASGIDRLVTQVFFDDEALNQSDPVLQSISDPGMRERLIAKQQAALAHGSPSEYHLDIVLRGDNETPFFDDWD
jgi:protocatechuate 3,4-dioxygenase beta subunit